MLPQKPKDPPTADANDSAQLAQLGAGLRDFLGRKPIQNARWVFVLMFLINAFNYLDRLIVTAVAPTIRREFHISEGQLGYLASAFIIIYTLSTLPAGLLGDRFSRARVIAVGVAIWSIMSTATAFITNFFGLFATRALVGVGEASYAPAGTALLGNYFHRSVRGRVMSLWQAAQIVGIILAYLLSALFLHVLEPSTAWRVAFFVAGAPGLVLAALMWFVADKPKAAHLDEEEDFVGEHGHISFEQGLQGAWALMREAFSIPTVWLVVVMEACTFIVVTPALTFLTTYLETTGPFHLQSTEGLIITAIVAVIGGLAGFTLGGILSDRLSARYPGGRLIGVAIGFGAGVPLYAVALLTPSLPIFVIFGVLAVTAINMPVGPLVAVVQDATPSRLRATAFSLALMLGHLLGDAWAPSIVGTLSDHIGHQTGIAMLIVGVPSLAIAALVAFFGRPRYAKDMAASAALE